MSSTALFCGHCGREACVPTPDYDHIICFSRHSVSFSHERGQDESQNVELGLGRRRDNPVQATPGARHPETAKLDALKLPPKSRVTTSRRPAAAGLNACSCGVKPSHLKITSSLKSLRFCSDFTNSRRMPLETDPLQELCLSLPLRH